MWWPLTGMRTPDGSPLPGTDGEPVLETTPFTFEPLGEDVQVLNQRAIHPGDLDITAISAHAYPSLHDRYRITACGGSFGEGYGPKVVVRQDDPRFAHHDPHRLTGDDVTIAVPGRHTTAFLALSLLLDADAGPPFNFVEMRFDKIIDAVRTGRVDAGVLIHEAQLTFEQQGLAQLAELGAWWHDDTKLPLPLGLNVVLRNLDDRFGNGSVEHVSKLLSDSVRHARSHSAASRRFLLARAGDRPEWRDDVLVERYLAMYVSDLTQDMGEAGREALNLLFARGSRAGLCPDAGEIDLI